MEKAGNSNGLQYVALKTWPALPFLGMGLWFAWSVMAFTGVVWISDVEVSGENISRLFLSSTLSYGLLCIVAALANVQFTRFINSQAIMIFTGVIGAVGALLIIISGPYYLVPYLGSYAYILFYTGGVLTGISTGFILLKCGQLYSRLSPKKVLLYCGLSQIVVVCVYFITVGAPTWVPVAGGPSISSIISFILLLPLAAATLSLEDKVTKQVKPEQDIFSKHVHEKGARQQNGSLADEVKDALPKNLESFRYKTKNLPLAFWKFVLMLFLFSTFVNTIRAVSVHVSPVVETTGSAAVNMLIRLGFALILIVVAFNRDMGKINFGKIYSFVVLIIVFVIALLPMIDVLDSSLNLTIVCCKVVFGVIVFCLLVFISNQKNMSSVLVLGYGYGVYMLGNTLGWLIASYNPLVFIDGQYLHLFYLLIAGVILLLTFFLFSERDLDRLFSAITSSDTTLQSVLVAAEDKTREEQPEVSRTPGRFTSLLNDLAIEYSLSSREADILRYLAMGRGTDYIAETLSISSNTVRTHTQKVYTKLGVHSRSELMSLVDEFRK